MVNKSKLKNSLVLTLSFFRNTLTDTRLKIVELSTLVTHKESFYGKINLSDKKWSKKKNLNINTICCFISYYSRIRVWQQVELCRTLLWCKPNYKLNVMILYEWRIWYLCECFHDIFFEVWFYFLRLDLWLFYLIVTSGKRQQVYIPADVVYSLYFLCYVTHKYQYIYFLQINFITRNL